MKIVLPVAILALAVGVLVFMGVVEGSIRVLKLHDLKAHPQGQVCRIDGELIDSIEQLSGPLRFTIRSASDRDLKLQVESRVSAPDNFKPGNTVSVKGVYDTKAGLFLADDVRTSCPTRYEPSKAAVAAGTQAVQAVQSLPPSPEKGP